MAHFAAKAEQLGFTHIELNTSVSPQMLHELLDTGVAISSIHSPCPSVLSSRGVPVSSLSLSSVDERERKEAVSFTKRTVGLAADVGAKAVVVHMGEVPIDPGLQTRLHKLYDAGLTQTKEYGQAKEELVLQRASQAAPYFNAARRSLDELCDYSGQKGILLGLETRFHLNEIPNMEEMSALLDEVQNHFLGYWHDVGHAEVQQQLGFSLHEQWLSRFQDRMIGVHLHDIHGISDHHAPGRGHMNWEMIAKYLRPGVIRVCEIGEWNDEKEMRGVIKFLTMKGVLSQSES